VTVTDDLGATVQREVRLFPNAKNLPPQLGWSTASQSRGRGAAALLDPAAMIADADSAGLEGGELLVEAASDVELSILPSGEVSISGSSVHFEGVNVGTFTASGGRLAITFSDAATPKPRKPFCAGWRRCFPQKGRGQSPRGSPTATAARAPRRRSS
jgi:hypothetical protein